MSEKNEMNEMIEAEITAHDYVEALIPEAQIRLLDDEWAYEVTVNGKVVGKIRLADDDNIISGDEEILEQVKKIAKRVRGEKETENKE